MDLIPISVVCYNNEDEVLLFAKEIMRQSNNNKIILLVTCNRYNNKNQLENGLKKTKIHFKLYFPPDNLGYLHGCLFGLKEYGNVSDYKWSMISNTDVSFIENDFFCKCFQFDKNEQYWGIAPNIRRASNGMQQNPFMLSRPNRAQILRYRNIYSSKFAFFLYFKLSKLKRKIFKREVPPVNSGPIYAADGSCFVLKKECINKLLENKDPIFMYGEELLIAEIVRENGYMIYYNENVHVVHHENQTTGKVNHLSKQPWFAISFQYIYSRFFE